MDLAVRLRGLQQGLQLYRAAGDRHFEATALHNLRLAYGRLGLFRRALRCIHGSIALRAANARPAAMVNPWGIASGLEALAGHDAAALATLQRAQAAHAADPQPRNAAVMAWPGAVIPALVAAPSKQAHGGWLAAGDPRHEDRLGTSRNAGASGGRAIRPGPAHRRLA